MINTIFARLAAAVKNGAPLRGCVFLGVMVLLSGSTALMGSSINCTSSGCSGNLETGMPLTPNPNALAEVFFTVSNNTSFTVTTTSVDGPPGSCGSHCGFYPVLWLFDTSMNQLGKDDPPANTNASLTCQSGGTITCPQLPSGLTAGTSYELVLSSFDQHWCLANGMACNGVMYSTSGWSNNGSFHGLTDFFSMNLSVGTGALSLTSATVTANYPVAQAVPEPASLALLLTGGAFLTWRKLAKGR